MSFDLHSLMMDLTPGDGISVEYESKRGNGNKSMEGEVVECVIRENKCRLRFRRDDGQMCVVRDDGTLLSLGSNYPYTGGVLSAKILEDYADTPYLQRFG